VFIIHGNKTLSLYISGYILRSHIKSYLWHFLKYRRDTFVLDKVYLKPSQLFYKYGIKYNKIGNWCHISVNALSSRDVSTKYKWSFD
jgi:hypothetical protein